ncbi:hypothetical protein ALC56_07548 [Trachymyrmex septentrionalis]|uniref:DNA-directed DNA polymerase n=1 Tax=Trachymyrmex septentrionalis TaxID=34720 RepID=A0A151JVX8_9HYME|nr:hypothetical protein ALC56_07548 [Trachymyrmex septentrionalis]
MVYNFRTFGRGENPMYDGCSLLSSLGRESSCRLNVMYYEGSRHYNPILNLKAAAGSRGGYCVACNVGFRNNRGHRCSKKCPRCYATPSCELPDVELINVCESIKICNGCGRLINSKSRHDCDVIYCKTCRSLRSSNHLCYMRPLCRKATVENPGEGTSTMALREENPQTNTNDAEDADERVKKDRVAFVFYDFETRQDETLEGTENVRIHVPTLCVAQQICEACAGIEAMSLRCRWCGVREFVFSRDPVKEFVDFATRSSKYFKKFICIGHNAKAFDAQFILKYIVEKSGITEEPRVILNGTKIIVMTVGRTKCIDSSNYISMRHAGRGREYRIAGTSVDGYYEVESENETSRYVLQFHGCFWHVVPAVQINRERLTSGVSREDTIDARYERTFAMTWRLRQRRYRVIEKRECEFSRKKRENHEMKSTEKIRYVDVCSLYMYVLKTGTFLLGQPTIYIGGQCLELIGAAPNFNFDCVEGIIRCTVLPPRDLFYPVLPYRVQGKLLFGLCRSCCETFSQAECIHYFRADREFVGAWGGLFTEYINSFLKLKQEASGWPSECLDDEIKEQYLRKYEKTEGIVFNKNNIARNPGLRSVAKLCLNSFWGKFGQ